MIRTFVVFALAASAVPLSAAWAAPAPGVTITVAPTAPIIERHGTQQLLNFDMMVANKSSETYRIAKVEMSVYDGGGHLASRKALNTDAFAPSIAVIGNQILAPGATLDVFNPFSQFEMAMPLARLSYDFCLQREATPEQREANRHRLPDDCDFISSLPVTPRIYDGKTPLALPLKGKVFIWEGHDFYAHHLRVPFSMARVKAMGITANSNEFASDFIYTDAQGNAYHGDPRVTENWYSYGKPIYAPGSGTVRETANDIPDNKYTDEKATDIAHPKLPPGKDPKDIGNYVLIDHGNGEYSLLVHMKPGSVRVKPGDHVSQGQMIGQIGFAGDSLFPHLHYSLMEGPEDEKSWGIPAYFNHFRRYFGAASQEIARDTVNSGDFVESDAR
ncbi:MAG TPA: M23 family metallopeptidase [Rhizomicrobium sp.]|nr:M23 family metallopeptidase [Rhizomicrobium sp.]